MTMTWRARILSAEELSELRADPSLAREFVHRDDHPLELKRTWYGLKWIMVHDDRIEGGAEDSILGGAEIGERIGTSPARLVGPDEVAEISLQLAEVTPDHIRDGFDIRTMMREAVYPPIWDQPDVLEGKLVPAFTKLKKLYAKAAEQRAAILIVVS